MSPDCLSENRNGCQAATNPGRTCVQATAPEVRMFRLSEMTSGRSPETSVVTGLFGICKLFCSGNVLQGILCSYPSTT